MCIEHVNGWEHSEKGWYKHLRSCLLLYVAEYFRKTVHKRYDGDAVT